MTEQKTEDYSGYDQATNLVREQMAAMQEYRQLLARCQAENEKLILGLRFYAERDWRELSMVDRGEKAKTILRETMGYGRSKTV